MPWLKGALAAKYRNTGQACVAANRMLVKSGAYDLVAKKLADAAAALKGGNGMHEEVVLGPPINEDAVKKVEEHIADTVEKGTRIATGSKRQDFGRELLRANGAHRCATRGVDL